jgi:ATP-dependent Clp protease ATP-binding subunit ClpB
MLTLYLFIHSSDRALLGDVIPARPVRLAERDIGLETSDEAMELLADAGFEPVYAAWSLKRAIQQRLENPLAEAILRGDFASGDKLIVTVSGGEFDFRKP